MDASPARLDRSTRKFANATQAAQYFGIESLPLEVTKLFKQPRFEQGTREWLLARWNFLTASVAAVPLGSFPSRWQTPSSLYTEKTNPLDVNAGMTTNVHMQRGKDNEDVAALIYERETGRRIIDFGMLLHWKLYDSPLCLPCVSDPVLWFNALCTDVKPYWMSDELWKEISMLNWFAGSPDGVTTDGRLLEIKCPSRIATKVPEYYYAQVQVNMQVMNLNVCDFFQYNVATGEFSLQVVSRDDAWFNNWFKAAYSFWSEVRMARVNPVLKKRPLEQEEAVQNQIEFHD